MDITFEMNLDLQIISRDGYTILDWLSDVGGIQSIIFSGLAIFIGFWNYNYLDNYMAAKLFKSDARLDIKMDASRGMSLREAFNDMVPSFFSCCRLRISAN